MELTYNLVVTAKEPNVNFETELSEYNDRSRFGIQVPYPEKDRAIKTLEMALTADQFAAIKRAALEVF